MALSARNSSANGFLPAFDHQGYLRAFINFDQLYDAAVGPWKVTSAAIASSVDVVDAKLASAVATKQGLRARNAWVEYAKEYVLRPTAPSEVDEIGQTVGRVMTVVDSLGPKALNLSDVHSDSLQCDHMVAVLRSTFLWKEEVPGWSHALRELTTALAKAGHEPRDVLVGLE